MRYQIDSEAVLSATASVRASISRLQAEVSGFHGQLIGLQGSWSGQASTAFQAAVTDWKATEQRVEENLAALNAALGQAGQSYADVEASNARLFAR